jgi:hypothetical protein
MSVSRDPTGNYTPRTHGRGRLDSGEPVALGSHPSHQGIAAMVFLRNLSVAAVLMMSSPSDPRVVDFGLLAAFEYHEGMKLPAEVVELDRKEVRISGFMRGENGATDNLEFFMVVNEACGCAGEPKLNEVIFCAMPEGQRVNVAAAPVKVTGTLYVGEDKDGDYVLSLYRMEIRKIDE